MSQIDPDCAAGIDCTGCNCEVYCPQRDSELKRRQHMSNAYRPTSVEVERSEVQGDRIAIFRAEY